MSEIVDITVGVIQEEITISAVNNIGEITVNAVNNSEEINVTANTNLIQININTAPVSVINPQNYDLSQFTNTSSNPFVRQSTLSSYVPISRTLTINGTTLDLSADRSWTIAGATWGSITGTLAAQTDLQAALDARVPYTGAINNVNLGEYGLTAGQLTLDTTPTGTAAVGTTRWNDTIGSSETTLKGGTVILKNGVDLVARVVNKVTPNATLTKANYTAVRVSGAQGQRLAVAYAQANNDTNSADTLGLVTETIPTNQEGFIITVGQLDGINTTGSLQGETWSDGDVLYLSPTTPGAITNIKPTGLTGHIIVIGYVEYAHAIHGKIYVKIMNGWELDELHNVYINPGTLANNNILQYDSADQLWKNKTLPSFGITIGSTAISSGTAGRILFEGSGNVVQESANLFWDNTNGRLGIGTSSPAVSIDARNGFNLYTSGAAAGSHYLEAFSTTSTDATLNFRRTAGANGLYRFTLTGAQLNSDNTTGECQLRAANSFFWSVYSNGSETMRIPLTGNILINTTTDAGFKLDVNGTARVQGVITGSVGGGSLTLGAVSANQVAISLSGYFTGLGAINISNSNPRGYNVRLSAQGVAGFYSSVSSGDFQNFVTEINYFQGSGSIVIANAVSGSAIHGYLFNPTITNQGLAFVAGFRSMLASATNRWNLYIDGTASNYLASNLLINTTTDAGYKLDINGTSRFSGLTDFNADIVLNSNRIFMQSNSGNVLLRMVQTNNLQIYNNNSGATLYLNANGSVQIGQTNAINWATFSASGHTIYGTTNTNFFSSGNIGVNTATDAGYKLDVNGTFRSNGIWTDGSAVTSWGIGSSATAYGVLTWGTGYATICSTAGNVLHLGANGSSPDVTIDTSGNLGIGTTSPTGRNGYGGGTVIEAVNNSTYASFNINGGNIASPTYFTLGAQGNSADIRVNNKPLQVTVNSIDAFRIFTTGNVAINTITDAGFKLDVNGTLRVSAADAVSAFQITAPTRAWYFTTSAQGGTFNAISGSANGVAGLGNYGFVISNGWAFNIGLTTSQPDSLFSIYPTGTNQGEVRIGGQTGNSTSLLTLESTTKGFLPPRMTTTQKNAIATPAAGLVVYDTTLNALCTFDGTIWVTLGSGGGGGGSIIKLTSQTLTAASWTLVSGYYQYTFSNVNITTNTRVDFTPANASYTEVTTCGMLPQVDVAAGTCTFYSLFPPATDILGEITIFPTI